MTNLKEGLNLPLTKIVGGSELKLFSIAHQQSPKHPLIFVYAKTAEQANELLDGVAIGAHPAQAVVKETPKAPPTTETRSTVKTSAYTDELWGGDDNCEHQVYGKPRGGIECVKCGGWFCY